MQRYLSFNTSHVTLYHLCLRTAMVIITFQYISCYSLSWSVRRRQYHLCPFQYISCYSLSMTSKHYKYFQPKFQYISCYSLSRKYPWGNQREIGVSIHLMLLFILRQKTTDRTDGCFNTSHVTLYRRWTFQNRWQWTFQYISCYSLSIPEDVQDKIKKLFQYISCYSLSKISRPWSAVQIPFQYTSCYSLSNYDKLSDAWDYCFNTSHVTLYQFVELKICNYIEFQYISCYSLSEIPKWILHSHHRFNTSHVTLYQ